MLLKNLDVERELVNGSRGIVVGFQEDPSNGQKCKQNIFFSRFHILIWQTHW